MYSTLNSMHAFLQNHLGATLTIIIWALILSAVSMSIYWLFSPQNRLKQLKHELETVKVQINDADLMEEKPFQVISRLLSVSVQRVLFAFFPTVLATIPLIFFWDFLSDQYDGIKHSNEFISIGPWWIRGWWTVFIFGMISFSITIKSLLKIE